MHSEFIKSDPGFIRQAEHDIYQISIRNILEEMGRSEDQAIKNLSISLDGLFSAKAMYAQIHAPINITARNSALVRIFNTNGIDRYIQKNITSDKLSFLEKIESSKKDKSLKVENPVYYFVQISKIFDETIARYIDRHKNVIKPSNYEKKDLSAENNIKPQNKR